MMLRLVLGRLDYGGITTGGVTFRFTGGDARALSGVPDARLNALGKALINRVFRELNINRDSTHLESLSQVFEDCGFAMPASVKFTSEFNTDELKAILHSARYRSSSPSVQ